ncbi:hypothetical protein FSP39_008691 [Pinctada imbricata]|uniref:BHLH domain-containing protein n=1 Tax=Pinctada imbricata TaxID=66713 RepID=A0AA89BQS5_PINIB|nr:hypothetical protein FSP39_008691 [Pinctada imbricata]
MPPAKKKTERKGSKGRKEKTSNVPLNILPVPLTENPMLGISGTFCYGGQLMSPRVGGDMSTTVADVGMVKDELDEMTNVNEVASISSDQLLGFEDVYGEHSAPHTPIMDELGSWTAGMPGMSLIVGNAQEARTLSDSIRHVITDHDLQVCSQEEAFDVINSRNYALIWLLMSEPPGQDLLSLTTSIRYASKYNRVTVIIGVTAAPPTVDLRLHGIDEIILQPATVEHIREKYAKWTSVQLRQDEIEDIRMDVKPSASLESVRQTSMTKAEATMMVQPDRQATHASHDSGIQSPSSASEKSTVQLPSISTLRKLVPSIKQETRTRASTTADHTTKEKLRRERIKDSCDQLRVLLPYIRGRKTDMASILEMCVEYLKVVNAALPQDFQNQIIEILTNDTHDHSVDYSGLSKSGTGLTMHSQMNSGVLPDTVLVPSTEGSNAIPAPNVKTKREHTKQSTEPKTMKRIRLQPKPDGGVSSVVDTTTATTIISQVSESVEATSIQKTDHTIDQNNNNLTGFYAMHQSQQLYTENDGQRKFPPQDSFPAYYTATLPPKLHCYDRESYGMYIDSHTVGHFYTNNGFPSFNVMNIPDYVNPNAVLPVSSNTNVRKDAKK